MIHLEQFEQFAAEHGLPVVAPGRNLEVPEQPVPAVPAGDLEVREALMQRLFRADDPPPQPEVVLAIGNHTICTPGNLTVVSAKAKDGKTAVATAMMAAVLNPRASASHRLGFSASNPNGKAVVHFDTEQSRHDHHQVGRRVLRRAELDAQPSNFMSLFFTDLSIPERLRLFEIALEMAAEIHGGLRLVVIDGIADFTDDPNDTASAFALVAKLHQLAIRYDCPIICILHENPGSEVGKTRGHLGSQLERKAETNLRLARAEGKTSIWVERGRHCYIPREEGTRFQWSDLRGMHVLVQTLKDEKEEKRREELRTCAEKVFEAQAAALTYQEILRRIKEVEAIGESGARKRLKLLSDENMVRKGVDGKYLLSAER